MTIAEFQELSKGTCVVDFTENWCSGCKVLAPHLEKVCNKDGVDLHKVDCDKSQELVSHLKIQGIPYVMLYKNGQLVSTFTGAKSASFLDAELSKLK